jgi:hypothetical protein
MNLKKMGEKMAKDLGIIEEKTSIIDEIKKLIYDNFEYRRFLKMREEDGYITRKEFEDKMREKYFETLVKIDEVIHK